MHDDIGQLYRLYFAGRRMNCIQITNTYRATWEDDWNVVNPPISTILVALLDQVDIRLHLCFYESLRLFFCLVTTDRPRRNGIELGQPDVDKLRIAISI